MAPVATAVKTWLPGLTWASNDHVPSTPRVAKPSGLAVARMAPVVAFIVEAAAPSKISMDEALP